LSYTRALAARANGLALSALFIAMPCGEVNVGRTAARPFEN